jgi:hypothetical protein
MQGGHLLIRAQYLILLFYYDLRTIKCPTNIDLRLRPPDPTLGDFHKAYVRSQEDRVFRERGVH